MKNKGLIFGIITTVALMSVVATGVTLAALQKSTNDMTNTFDLGSVDTEIEEEGEGAVKKSRIKNVGENACYVRARVTISPAEAAEAIELTGKGTDWDWSQWANGDGYVYYTKVLPVGEASYTSYLFEGVQLKEGTDWKSLGIKTFDVTVYEESVQAEMNAADGSSTTEMMTIWSAYDSDTVPASFK